MPKYNLIEYSDNYSKTSGSLQQDYRDEQNANIAESESFKFKFKIAGNAPDADNKKFFEIAVLLKYLSNFSRTLKMPLISCEIISDLTWSEKCVTFSAVEKTESKITDMKLFFYVPVVTLSTKDNVKLLNLTILFK